VADRGELPHRWRDPVGIGLDAVLAGGSDSAALEIPSLSTAGFGDADHIARDGVEVTPWSGRRGGHRFIQRQGHGHRRPRAVGGQPAHY